MNIMINNYCNLSCPYCFASLKTKKPDNMSVENIRKIVEFSKRSGIRSFRVLGGEPTLHPQFVEIIRSANEDQFFQSVLIITNGIALTQKVADAIVTPKTAFLVNLNNPEILPKGIFEKTMENLSYMVNLYRKKGVRDPKITLSMNIYKPDFDYSYMINACRKLGLKTIRYTITSPENVGQEITLDHYRRYKDVLLRFFEDCYKNGFNASVDCNNSPKCIFNQDELANMMYTNQSTCFKNVCSPAVDVKPNLDVIRCFSMENVDTVKLTDFPTMTELMNYFMDTTDKKAFDIPTFEECKTCHFMKEHKCQGGCLAFKKWK